MRKKTCGATVESLCLLWVDHVVLLGHPVEVAGEPGEDTGAGRYRLQDVWQYPRT